MSRETHVRFCESARVRLPRATHPPLFRTPLPSLIQSPFRHLAPSSKGSWMICTSASSFRRQRWVLPALDSAAAQSLARQLHTPPIVAQLLINRGLNDPAAAARFLDPRFRDLHPPALLPNIAAAAERLARAVRAGEKITLYGDYDVDGITGTAMLWHTLKAAGANVEYYIPHRVDEGYGLNRDAVLKLIDEGTQLLVTVDCGCSAVDPIAAARERGVDVVVSDHHEFGPTLPAAYAMVYRGRPEVPRL